MAVDIPCAKAVFAQMQREVLGAIKTIASTAKASLMSLKAERQALSLSIDIALLPLKAKKAALDSIIKEARAKTQIIPPDMVVQCPQLGAINTNFEASILGKLEGVSNIIFDIDRLTSIKIDTDAQIAQFDAGIEFLDGVVKSIDEVLSSA
jgi:hypothetical protein